MTRRARQPASSDVGVATLSAAFVTAAVLGAALLLLQVALVVAAKHRAQSTADLAALAGSTAAVRGGDPCAAARRVADRQRAHLNRCTVDLAVVTVAVVSRQGRTAGVAWRAHATARAAPSYYVSPR